MFIESLSLTNFRCFGPVPTTIELTHGLTAFVGANGAGKTAVMQALLRLFGVTGEQRRLRRQDFHVPASDEPAPSQRSLTLEVILSFPELDGPTADANAVPEFFQQMAADDFGQLKCRLRLEATWTDDGSLEGAIDQKYRAVRAFGEFTEADCTELKAIDRTRIQMIYVPAARDGASQVAAFLGGRLWRAVNWSQQVRDTLTDAGSKLNSAFADETAVMLVAKEVRKRWQEVHEAGTDSTPEFRPVDVRLQEFIRKVEVVFRPDEEGRERSLADVSDGQRSLFHIAMTAATLDVEAKIAVNPGGGGFQAEGIPWPALTLIAVEEPENHLAPFYLSRIVRQIEDLTCGPRAQAVLSSHSASILARVDPSHVRHFRLDPKTRIACVRPIRLPSVTEEASKFIREAVLAYPELYFARFVVLGEGASEEVVLPRLAKAMGLEIDRSFVAVVPLGGRHVHHLWQLLSDLEIPYATLLDLDWGREGGGWGRIKIACRQLLVVGVPHAQIFKVPDPTGPKADLATFDSRLDTDFAGLREWVNELRQYGLYFCSPLDLDYSLLRAMPDAYQVPDAGKSGPSSKGDPRSAVLGEAGHGALYGSDHDEALRWYRYLFLGRGKPGTHVRVLSGQSNELLAKNAPEELRALIAHIANNLKSEPFAVSAT